MKGEQEREVVRGRRGGKEERGKRGGEGMKPRIKPEKMGKRKDKPVLV